jgi:hypothetical protein
MVLPFLFLFFAVVLSLAVSPTRPSPVELLLVLGFGIMAFFAARNIALFSLAVVPILSRHLYLIYQALPMKPPPSKPLSPRLMGFLNLILLVSVVIAAAIKIQTPLSEKANLEAIEQNTPVRAAEWILKAQPVGKLFNNYNWGGYVLWALYPSYLSFVDGRTDLFDDEILNEYLQAWRAEEGWQEILARWDIQLVLLEPYSPLASALLREGWDTLYEDDLAIVLGP